MVAPLLSVWVSVWVSVSVAVSVAGGGWPMAMPPPMATTAA
jgi:hypothetical protein